MRITPPSARGTMTIAGLAYVLATLLYVGAGCASGGHSAAKDTSALDSYVQGVLAYQNGDTTKAMTNLQDAVNKKSDLVMARSMLGDLHRARSEYDAAREQYEALARLDPYEYNNHYRLGLVYQFLERLREAAASYLRALDLKPNDAGSNLQLGSVYYSLNDPKEALKYAERAVQFDPNRPDAWVTLGMILDATGQYVRAEQAYRRSLDLDSANTGTRLFLGENLLTQGKALVDAAPAGTAEPQRTRAQADAAKKFGEARSVLAELVRVQDTSLNRKRLGDAYAAEGNTADALVQYQAALKLDPNYYPALNGIGEAHIREYEKGLTLDDAKRKAALDAWQQSLSLYRAQARIMALVQKYSKAPMFQQ